MRHPRHRRLLAGIALVATVLAFPLSSLASHDFGDVPDSNPFHADISALAASGVTSGCGGGNYCPSANVTREQMAAFLNRLGALQDGKSPVVNAAELDGAQAWEVAAGLVTIPSGVTVTGAYTWDWTTTADNQDVIFYLPLPGIAPVALTATTVNFAPHAAASDDDATCTGSSSTPTAPSGKVCIYIAFTNRVDGAQGLAGLISDRYFAVAFLQDAAGSGADMYLEFTWAYTAP